MASAKFVKPAGQKLSGPTTLISGTIQNLPGNGVMIVGISTVEGGEILRVGPNDPSAAAIEDIGNDSASRVRWFQLTGKRAGNVMVEARGGDGSVVDYFQLVTKNPPPVNLRKASGSLEFEFEPDDPAKPGQINMRVQPAL